MKFANFLKQNRLQAGYTSLDSACEAIKEELGAEISKSSLSLYERGEVKYCKPETLRLLAAFYNLSYEELALLYFESQYDVELKKNKKYKTFISRSNKSNCFLKGPTNDPRDDIQIISLAELERTQAELPLKSQVAVAATNFLDDHIFFEMVSKNIKRGIKYHYLMPENEYTVYKTLLERVVKKYPQLKNKLDGIRTFFYPRSNLDFPINYVLYLLPNEELKAYLGILHGTTPHYHQVADLRLAMRLYDGFRWAVTVAHDKKIKSVLFDLQQKVSSNTYDLKKKKSFLPY